MLKPMSFDVLVLNGIHIQQSLRREVSQVKVHRWEYYAGLLVFWNDGGEGGIRTHGTVPRTLAFEASTFNHSVTSPQWSEYLV
jgi:hypothetical protein